MDDLAMTCSDFVNALKMLICSEKHPVSRAYYGYTEKVVIDRWAIIWDFMSRTIFYKFWCIVWYSEPNNKV